MARNSKSVIAYHEAGHAVIANALRFKVHSVTIVPAVDSSGKVKIGGRPPECCGLRDIKHPIRFIVPRLAGPLAQKRYRPSSYRHRHGEDDHRYIKKIAQDVCRSDEEADALLRWLRLCTNNLIDQKWHQIERVAAALLERGRLTAPEIEQEIENATLALIAKKQPGIQQEIENTTLVALGSGS
jgi:hypothetical protein